MALKHRQIEAFRTVMREGSMVRASSAMSITQPAISYLIGSLESAVGFALFSRQGGKLSPTPEALTLMAEVDRLYEGLDAIESVAREIANFERDVVRIVITPPLSVGRILTSIGKFAVAHPGLKLNVDADKRDAIMHKVNSGLADLGILSLSESVEAVGARLFGSELVLVSAIDGAFGGRNSVGPRDLAGIPMVALTTKGTIRPMVDQWFADAGVKPNYVLEASEASMALQFVQGGLGATIVSSLSLPVGLYQDLIALPLAPARQVEIGAIVPSSQHPNRAVVALLDFLKSNVP